MFRKRQKRSINPESFIPKPARICAIIQLCLAFSLFLWNASEPFIGELFTWKSRLLFYQDVMGISAHENISKEKEAHLSRNAERFHALHKAIQLSLSEDMQHIQKQLQRSFWDKLYSLITLYVYRISPYELAWIFFSIVIAILLLKQVEGAAQAVWILPLLTALYAADSRLFAHPFSLQDSDLFPSEQQLVESYIKEPLSQDIFVQQRQLIQGWKRYLIVEWTHQIPSEDPVIFEQQAEDGEFSFTLARLQLRSKQQVSALKNRIPPSGPILLVYFFWNTYFAYSAWRCCSNVRYVRGLK